MLTEHWQQLDMIANGVGGREEREHAQPVSNAWPDLKSPIDN